MKEPAGVVFSIAERHQPVPGCTTSVAAASTDDVTVSHFALAAHTDISAESYGYPKLLLVDAGTLEVYTLDASGGNVHQLGAGDAIRTPLDIPVGMRTSDGCTYTELTLGKETIVNENVKAGSVFKLADLVPYQEGTIVNMDVAHNDGMKLAVMSFDAGTGLKEHAAPADALIFALEGEGIIGYEGEEHAIHAGENFKFDRNGRHYVRADKRFKMALLLVNE